MASSLHALGLGSLRPVRSVRAVAQPVAARTVLARAQDDGRPSNVGEFCSIDDTGKIVNKSLGEKELDFIEALQSYYFDGDMKMTDQEFENLKEELIWNGSQVAILSSTEQRFLEAMMSYTRGTPILDDEEFDELKASLRKSNSIVVQSGPRCSIRSRKVYSDASPDLFKMTLVNIPGVLIVLGVLFSIDDLTGFEITQAIELPQPWSLFFLWGIIFPLIYVTASAITAAILPDNLILKADCPNCGTNNQAYFGGIFNVAGNTKLATIECKNCLADLEFNNVKREVVVVTSAEEKQEKAAEAAQKKAAAAAKKKAKLAKAAAGGDDDE